MQEFQFSLETSLDPHPSSSQLQNLSLFDVSMTAQKFKKGARPKHTNAVPSLTKNGKVFSRLKDSFQSSQKNEDDLGWYTVHNNKAASKREKILQETRADGTQKSL